jgi:DNA (cytosine-5)-methyltransferase 1
MENVRAILSAALQPGAAPGSVIQAFATKLRALTDASYHMDCFEVNAVNYGAPQLRERAIFIGNRFNVVADLPDPTHGPSSQHPWRTLRDALDGLRDPGPVRMEFSERKLRYLGMVPPGSNWRSLPEDIQRESMGAAWSAKGGRSGWWRRLSMDLPCPTLVAAPNHASTALCHPEEVRALTLRECARIQEFPDDWAFHGSPSEQFKQVGNAVPVRLGTIVGEAVASELDALRERGWRPYAERPEAFRRVYIQSHVRTRRWHKEGVALVWGREDEARHAAPKTGRRTQKIQGA